MKADLLRVVTCIYNPIRWQTRIAHYRRFRQHMLDSGVKLTVVECALGRRPHELGDDPHVTHIAVRSDTLAWNKESLINLGIERGSPENERYLAWIDADVEFRNKNWASDTVHSLQQYAVVQPWSEGLDLGPRGEPMVVKGAQVQTSLAKVWRETHDVQPYNPLAVGSYGGSYPHPGYAWAIRRETLNSIGGLIEASGIGASDHQMAMAFVGMLDQGIHGATTPEYQACVGAWMARAYKFVQGNLGYVQGTLEHQFHGGKEKRRYHERWDILVKHKFNPVTDLRRNLYGVVELTGNKPAMNHDFDSYYRQRDEDQNSL